MLACTFFGHKDTPKEIEPALRSALVELIEKRGVLKFYVGNHGNFDNMARRCLIELKRIYAIDFVVVLAYLPTKRHDTAEEILSNTILPDGIETVLRKYAISYRNRWMIERSDYVITYVKQTFGGAAQFKELAERKGKNVINLAVQNAPGT